MNATLDYLSDKGGLKNFKIWTTLSFVVFLVAAFFSVGYHHFDEHFQILELAYFKLGFVPRENLPWEYAYQMRPAVQPFMVIILYKLLAFFTTPNPFFISTILRVLSALFTFFTVKALFEVSLKNFKSKKQVKWYLLFTFFLWFQFYAGVRFSSENWSANLFIWSYILYFRNQKHNFTSYLIIGLLVGLAFIFRFQTAFLSLGFLAWMFFIDRKKIMAFLGILLGGLSMLVVGYAIDSWYYGESVMSFWNYFQQNILEDKVSGFEIHPWWYYITEFVIKAIPPISILFLLAIVFFLYKQRKHAISWIILPFILVHTIIGHKEVRFLYPIIGFLPIILFLVLEDLEVKKWLKVVLKWSFILNLVFVGIVSFRPADAQIPLYKVLYDQFHGPTVLYHLGKNPYHRITEVYFYKRANLEIKQIDSLDEIKDLEGRTELLVVDQKQQLEETYTKKPVYNTFPNWLLKFNFNNWQKRTKSWRVYELN